MDGWLKALVAGACVVVIVGGGYLAWREYDNQQSQKHAAHAAALSRITADNCNAMAAATIPISSGQSPKTLSHQDDLVICGDMGLLGAYERHQLQLSGILK